MKKKEPHSSKLGKPAKPFQTLIDKSGHISTERDQKIIPKFTQRLGRSTSKFNRKLGGSWVKCPSLEEVRAYCCGTASVSMRFYKPTK